MSKDHVIIGIHVKNRKGCSQKVQELLTEYGCSIKTRLGLHEASDEFCSASGLIILELVKGSDKKDEICAKLKEMNCVDVQTMAFSE